jgi:hypothetical protein
MQTNNAKTASRVRPHPLYPRALVPPGGVDSRRGGLPGAPERPPEGRGRVRYKGARAAFSRPFSTSHGWHPLTFVTISSGCRTAREIRWAAGCISRWRRRRGLAPRAGSIRARTWRWSRPLCSTRGQGEAVLRRLVVPVRHSRVRGGPRQRTGQAHGALPARAPAADEYGRGWIFRGRCGHALQEEPSVPRKAC